jgi:cytochrome b
MTTRDPSDVLVWDAPVRVFHWLLVASFAGAWLTAESERWRLVHVTLGYTMAGLLVFRVLWGLVGTRHARFGSFVRGPRAVLAYLRSLVGGTPQHHTGHNPAGAIAIVALLALIAITAASGWAAYNDWGGQWFQELHEGTANTMLGIVLVHLVGVGFGSWVHRENLVRSMLTGRKHVPSEQGIRSAWRTVGVLMLAATLGFWWLQWRTAPEPGTAPTPLVKQHPSRDDD